MAKKQKDKLLAALCKAPENVYGFGMQENKDIEEAKKRILDSSQDEAYRKQLLEELLSATWRECRNDYDMD